MRTYLKNLAALVRPLPHRVGVRELLDLCQTADPSEHCKYMMMISPGDENLVSMLVPTGGMLFEFWLENYASWKIANLYQTALKESFGELKMQEDEFAEYEEAEGMQFLAHTWLTLGNIGKSAQTQLHFISLLLKTKGVSRSGLQIAGKLGMCSKHTQFGRWEAEARNTAVDDAK